MAGTSSWLLARRTPTGWIAVGVFTDREAEERAEWMRAEFSGEVLAVDLDTLAPTLPRIPDTTPQETR